MALYNPEKAKSVLDQPNRGILGDSATQAGQPAYQNAYQAVMGQGPSIGETPDWFQQQRMSFYAPQDINKEATDLYTSTSGQAEDWRSQGQKQYQDFAKQYGTETPWLFRAQSEGGLGADASKFNLIADPTKRYDFKGDVGSNQYMQSLYGGDPGIQSSYLEAQFNPLTGKQEGAFDLFHKYNQGPAVDTGRRGFGSFMDTALGVVNPYQNLMNIGKSGMLGSGIQRTTEGFERSLPGYDTKQNVYNKLYGYTPQAAKPMFQNVDKFNQGQSQAYNSLYSGSVSTAQSPTQAVGNAYQAYQSNAPQQPSQPTYVGQNSAYSTRFQNPYRRNPYGY